MKEIFKQKYNILIPGFLVLVVIIALVVYGNEYKNNRYAESSKVKVYQYFNGVKMEYESLISRNKKNVILGYEPSDTVVNLDSTPIYTEKHTVIFPKEMVIVFPLKDELYTTNVFSEVYNKNDLYY